MMEVNQEEDLQKHWEEKRPLFDGKDVVFSLLSIIIAYIAVQEIAQDRGGFWTTMLSLIFVSSIYGYARVREVKLSWIHYGYLGYIFALSLSFSLFENKILMGTNSLLLFFSCMYWVLVVAGTRKGNQLSSYVFFDFIDGFLVRPFKNVAAGLSIYRLVGKEHKSMKLVILGIVISFPVAAIVISLLSSADSMFERFIRSAANFISVGLAEQFMIFLIAIPLGMYLFLCVYRNLEKAPVSQHVIPSVKGPDVLFLTILFIFISIYLLFFVAAIMGYIEFRNGDTAYTLSAYAREGFFQLLAVSLINVGIFSLIKLFSHSSKGIKVSLSIIGIETLALVILGFAKMQVYIQAFGLTPLRFNTSWFMVVLALCICVFIASLWQSFKYLRAIILIVSMSVLFMSYRNTGNDIVSYNYENYQRGELRDLDISIFYMVGVEGVPTAVKAYEEAESGDDKASLKEYLQMMQQQITSSKISNLQRSRNAELIKKAIG
ncbi:DUF4153 domain-containing protein [Enterococcus sp. BWR-S5]|uniref:DUF4153 domain-containing protein n=1 Tax=Enterococcus sp. BWR-S5 TaxID=2787714 RepID=UPI001922C190|nr:DUF4173 domain-containing protein [Enterococcus sp. BWR-S5]MBL1226055.1 DUF4173 domain-containing protein [Enterococcus sp. BWR-S5]